MSTKYLFFLLLYLSRGVLGKSSFNALSNKKFFTVSLQETKEPYIVPPSCICDYVDRKMSIVYVSQDDLEKLIMTDRFFVQSIRDKDHNKYVRYCTPEDFRKISGKKVSKELYHFSSLKGFNWREQNQYLMNIYLSSLFSHWSVRYSYWYERQAPILTFEHEEPRLVYCGHLQFDVNQGIWRNEGVVRDCIVLYVSIPILVLFCKLINKVENTPSSEEREDLLEEDHEMDPPWLMKYLNRILPLLVCLYGLSVWRIWCAIFVEERIYRSINLFSCA